MIELGKTKIKMSRLGQGTGVHGGNRQSDQTRMGFAKLVDLMHHAYDRGIRFFDLADLYGTHVYFREALRGMKRDQLTILTKMWWRYDGPEEQTTLPERRQMARTALERFRHELTTYPDIVLLHCLMKPDWDQQMGPYMDVLNDAKAKGQIKAVGCSCHDLGAMKTAAACPWVDVMLARINMKGGKKVMMDGSREEVEAVLRTARANGKAIIGMKIFGEGRLAERARRLHEVRPRQRPVGRHDDRLPQARANRRRAAADAQAPGKSGGVKQADPGFRCFDERPVAQIACRRPCTSRTHAHGVLAIRI